jgi:hypothetical protein
MHIEISDTEKTNLIIFLDLAKRSVEEMELLPNDEYLRIAMLRDLESLLKKFEN